MQGTSEPFHAGSSPRMRGAPLFIIFILSIVGIIPADAGSTVLQTSERLEDQDHPRGCGEHSASPKPGIMTLGSSPRMLGAQNYESQRIDRTGIIPADAGSTAISQSGIPCPKDHPRGCGEHMTDAMPGQMNQGSSPRMRGALPSRHSSSFSVRIIPADAGSTARSCGPATVWGDHPRGCGEHLITPHEIRCRLGSSPRMRGAPDRGRGHVDDGRIIPADAGCTRGCGLSPRGAPDHPRGCGEHRVVCISSPSITGSSPRMRGALRACRGVGLWYRIIPTDAGSTVLEPQQSKSL